MVKQLTPCPAHQRMERSLVTGSHTCGCGFWSGCGNRLISRSVVVEAMTGMPAEYRSGGPTWSTWSRPRPTCGWLKLGDGLLVVPLRPGGRDTEELPVVGEGRLGPGFDDEVVGLLEVGPVPLLVLDRGA